MRARPILGGQAGQPIDLEPGSDVLPAHGQVGDRSGHRHPGQHADTFDQLHPVGGLLLRTPVTFTGQSHAHAQQVLGLVAEGAVQQPDETPAEQTRADREEHGEGDLRGHDGAQEPAPAERGTQSAPREPEGLERRRHSRRKPSHGGHEERGDKHTRVDHKRPVELHRRRHERPHAGEQPGARHRTADAGEERQQDALRENHPQQPQAAGPERRTDGHLPDFRCRASQQQRGHVGRGDQQQTDHCAGQREKGRAGLVAEFGEQRFDPDRVAAIGGRERRSEARHHRVETPSRPFHRQVACESGEAAVLPRVPPLGTRPKRYPRHHLVGLVGQERRAGHTDHHPRLAVQGDCVADHLVPAAEAALPERVADDGRGGGTRLIFAGQETATSGHGQFEDLEVVGGDHEAAEHLGAVEAGQALAGPAELGVAGQRDGFEQSGLALVVQEVGAADAGLASLVQAGEADDPIGVRERRWRHQDRVRQREDGGGRADAKCERAGGQQAQARVAPDSAEGLTDVVAKRQQHERSLTVSAPRHWRRASVSDEPGGRSVEERSAISSPSRAPSPAPARSTSSCTSPAWPPTRRPWRRQRWPPRRPSASRPLPH